MSFYKNYKLIDRQYKSFLNYDIKTRVKIR